MFAKSTFKTLIVYDGCCTEDEQTEYAEIIEDSYHGGTVSQHTDYEPLQTFLDSMPSYKGSSSKCLVSTYEEKVTIADICMIFREFPKEVMVSELYTNDDTAIVFLERN